MLAHPELYRLVKSLGLADRRRHPGLAASAGVPSARIAEVIDMLTAEGGKSLLDVAERSTRVLIAAFADGHASTVIGSGC